ncbi:chemotaxis protein CheA [Salinarchaeum sp. Harcht-Bsk1]|uniref:chemotaxis protein CheA n=1 Tax=Salinarchaeum sp. Harcht-Bsk1 TaxID=1333523 RepID=UPI0003422F7E|nr:chemotaxis protein CheA [Salinarchaeum sp. Harcht-Bsk1]AGN00004.1 chemotaxis protein CheA [Salinarchaeum sp. Harcht-Bsk1]
MADYLEAFARESEEQITELNNALLEFENDPTDEAAMEQIFRTAHTLKGNSGAMGFDPAEELAHAIEDLLEAIRSNHVSVTPELMDAIFDGVDELDAMISEAVEEGEIQRAADDEIATLRAYAEAEGLAAPTDAAIEDLLDNVSARTDSEHSVYHVRLDVAGDPAVHGRAVVDALDDAFELLGTDPDGETIDTGDYDGTIDAAFASVVERAAVEAALDPVDAVSDQVITDATDRMDELTAETVAEPTDDAGDSTTEEPAESMDDVSVDELLSDDDVDQFDDLDEMAEEVGDTSEFEDLGDAGSFADLGITEDDVEIEGVDTADEEVTAAEEAETSESSADTDDVPADEGEVEDAASEFAQLKAEVDPVGFDELQDELADLEFDEYDSDDEVGFDELLDEDELEDDGSFAESTVTASAAEDAAADAPATSAVADDDAGDAAETAGGAESAEDLGSDATAEDLFGGVSEETDEGAMAEAEDPATADAAVDIDEATTEAQTGGAALDDVVAESDDAVAGSDDTAAESDDAPVESGDSPADVGTSTAEAGASAPDTDEPAADVEESVVDAEEPAGDTDVLPLDAEEPAVDADDTVAEPDDAAVEGDTTSAATDDEDFDAAQVLDAESLDESAQSFGEGGMDLSDSEESTADEDVPTADEELDLDDSFGEMEADAAAEAAAADAEATDAADDAPDDGFDLGSEDVDFGVGSVAGSEESPEDATDEGVAVGGALEDDSFGSDVTTDSLGAEASADVDAAESEAAEAVDGFGDADDGVLDLDGDVGGSDAPPAGDEGTLEPVETEDVGPGARITDDAESSFEGEVDELGGSLDDSDADTLEDPGFSDATETEADDGPDVDEDRLDRIRSLGVPSRDADAEARAAGTQSIRVDVESLDRMLNMVEGLVTSRARLRRALIENEPREVLEDELDDLEDVTSELQDTVMDVRLVPLRTAVNKLPRIVRDVAREEDKQVDFEMVGEDVQLDRSILDEIGDPLVHLVRNAIDHGIETPDVREESGKPAEGSVELRATRERDRVTITVEDDGAGIDADAVRDAAVEEGIHTRSEVDSMDDEDVHELIFHAGFSTAAEVTDVSGRGVGMDVVAETVDRLDGSVTVESEPGEGTTITMELPVTLAIAEVLFVDVGGEEYGIPIKNVDEIGPVVGVETQDGQEVLVSDGGEDRRQLIRLDEALSTPERSDPNAGMLVHLRDDVREAAIHCDQVREQQEVVVKPFEGVLSDVPGLGGASVLGDGDVVTILDVETL